MIENRNKEHTIIHEIILFNNKQLDIKYNFLNIYFIFYKIYYNQLIYQKLNIINIFILSVNN